MGRRKKDTTSTVDTGSEGGGGLNTGSAWAGKGDVNLNKVAKVYPIPETREDYLALHKCLKDLGVNSTSDLEVRASRL